MLDVTGAFAAGTDATDAELFTGAGHARARFGDGGESNGASSGKGGVIEKSTTS
jgi:hypothetical protein